MRRPVAIALGWSVLVGVCSILAYVAVGDGGLLSARAEGESPQAVERAARKTPPPVNVLVSARDGRLVRGADGITRLVLRGLEPQVEMFDTSPRTERVAIAPWIWARQWKWRYARHEPNATIVWRTRAGRQALSVSLASGSLDGGRMSFAVRRLATGSKRALPITARLTSPRVVKLGRVDLFVDPAIPGTPQFAVQQALIALAQIPIGKQIWDVAEEGGKLSPTESGDAYLRLISTEVAEDPEVSLALYSTPTVAFVDLPKTALTLATVQNGGGYFGDVNLAGGSLTLGTQYVTASNIVMSSLDVSGGSFSFSGPPLDPPSGNIIVRGNFTSATVDLRLIGPNNIFVTPTFSSTKLNPLTNISGATFLGADMSGLVLRPYYAYDFSGATFGSYDQPSPSGGTATVNSAFDGMTLTEYVTLSGGRGGPTVLQGVSFTGTTLDGVGIAGATLTGCSFTNASIGEGGQTVSFAGAAISGTTFQNATITRADFSNATLGQADFSLAKFTGGPGDLSFRGATLSPGTVFTAGGNIELADFTGAIMDGVVFAKGNGAGPSTPFIGQLLTQIADTTANGVIINNTQYVKSGGDLFQIVGAAGGGTQWQPVTVGGGPDFPVTPSGPPIDPPGPEPGPDPDPDGNAGPAAIQASFG